MDEATPVPRLSLFQYAYRGHAYLVNYKHANDAFKEMLSYMLANRVVAVAHHLVHDTMSMLVNDASCADLLIECYDQGLFEDTLLNEKLDDIARGEYDNQQKGRWCTDPVTGRRRIFYYGLADSVLKRLGIVLDKGADTYRLRWDELRETPVDLLPVAAATYARNDALGVAALRERQDEDEISSPAKPGVYVFADAAAQARAGFGLGICRWLGVRTDPVMTTHVKNSLRVRQAAVMDRLYELGFVRRPKWMPKAKRWTDPQVDQTKIKTTLMQAARELGVELKLAPKALEANVDPATAGIKEIALDKEARERVYHHNAPKGCTCAGCDIKKYGEYQSVSKLIGYTTILEKGFVHPIHSEPNTLVANGRISWGSDSPDGVGDDAKSVNLTNLPKEPGIRESYIPPPGNWMWAIDFSQLELCTVAQVCLELLGYSSIADLINQGVDLHTRLSLLFLRSKGIEMTVEQFNVLRKSEQMIYGGLTAEDIRNASKRTNFGFLGGMGVDKFMSQNRDLKLSRHDVEGFKKTFISGYTEMKDYFKIAAAIAEGPKQIVQLGSFRIRGGLEYCDTANTFFSGLAADGVKEALYLVQREFFFDRESVMYGNGGVFADVHDELVGFARIEKAHEVVERANVIMKTVMQRKTPGVKISTSAAMMLRWRKGAKEHYIDGRMVPFEFSPTFRKLVSENTPEKIKMIDEPLLYDGTYPGYV